MWSRLDATATAGAHLAARSGPSVRNSKRTERERSGSKRQVVQRLIVISAEMFFDHYGPEISQLGVGTVKNNSF